MFEQFETKMKVMNDTLAKLQAENGRLQAQCQLAETRLVEVADERAILLMQLAKDKKSKEKLEKQCRKLQLKRVKEKAEHEAASAKNSHNDADSSETTSSNVPISLPQHVSLYF